MADLKTYSDFLEQFRNPWAKDRTPGQKYPFTHTTMWKYRCTHDIEDLDQLYLLYENCRVNGQDLYLSEKPTDFSPLLIDIDMEFDEFHSERQYTKENLLDIIEHINDILEELYNIQEDEKLYAFIFEKSSPTDKGNGKFKDGFHIMYPNIALSNEIRLFIINTVQSNMDKEECFEELKFLNPIDDVFDKCVVGRNNWLLYGSKKEENGSKYELTYIIDRLSNELSVEDYLNSGINITQHLSVRKFTEDDFNELEDAGYQMTEEFQAEISIIKDKLNRKKTQKSQQQRINTEDFDSKIEDDDSEEYQYQRMRLEDLTLVKKLIRILGDERRDSYFPWLHVLWCCRNIDNSLLNDCIKWSRKSSKFENGACERVWANANTNGNGYGIASLHFWAKEDNPEEYQKIMASRILEVVRKAAEDGGTHYSVACILYEKYKHIYKYTGGSKKGKGWYHFYDHRWNTLTNASTLSIKISTEIIDEFKKIQQYYYSLASQNDDDDDDTEKKIKNIREILKKLKTSGFKNAVIEESSNLFLDDKFTEKLDENKNLLGFDNGVYDLENMIFRPGQPDDYISFSTGYDYQEFDMNHEYIQEIEEFFRKVQTQEDMKQYLLTVFASCLDGYNKRQRFVIFTGQKGSNGKSTSIEFLQMALGDYASTMPHTVLTRKSQNASNATPEMADKRGVRFVVLNEPDNNDEINVGKMKELAGNDKILARALHSDPFYFKPQFKMILVCNKLPYINSDDGGTWRRVRVTPWDSRFLDPDEEITNPEKEFYKDFELDAKMERWTPAFMWLLINKYYRQYKEEGMIEPYKVKEFSDKYRKESDYFFEFLSANFEATYSKKDRILYKVFAEEFRAWFAEMYSGRKLPVKKDIIEYYTSNDFRITKTYFYGIKRLEDNEDDEESKEETVIVEDD